MAETDDARDLYAAAKNEELAAELELRGLPKAGTKDELVERLVAHDETKAAEAAKADAPKVEGAICAEHWPDGWPGDNVGATCEHGSWQRNEPAPAP
jgi:SAP domain